MAIGDRSIATGHPIILTSRTCRSVRELGLKNPNQVATHKQRSTATALVFRALYRVRLRRPRTAIPHACRLRAAQFCSQSHSLRTATNKSERSHTPPVL
eukprot:2468992-Prymnesium_polylepis.2